MTPDQSAILRALDRQNLTARQIAEAAFGPRKEAREGVYRHLDNLVAAGWIVSNNSHPARWSRTDAGTEALRAFDETRPAMDPHAVVRMIVKNGRVGN